MYKKHEMKIFRYTENEYVVASDFLPGDGNTGGAEWEDE